MGANLQVFGFKDNIKTVEQAKKNFEKRAEQDRYENGHSYSGTMGMLCSLRDTGLIFNTVEEFEKWLEPKGKDDGYLVRIRVIRETAPLKKAKVDLFYAERDLFDVDSGRIYARDGSFKFETVKPTPALKRRLQAKLEKAAAKHKKLLDAQLAKSTKTCFMGGGWVSE
jgi:hypothetical protein